MRDHAVAICERLGVKVDLVNDDERALLEAEGE